MRPNLTHWKPNVNVGCNSTVHSPQVVPAYSGYAFNAQAPPETLYASRHRITQLIRRLVVPFNSGYVVHAQAPPATLYATTSLQNYPAYTSPASQDPFTGAVFVAGLLSSSREVVNSGSYGHYASSCHYKYQATPYPVGTTNTGAIDVNVDWFVNSRYY